jgi:hypothetical protein
MPPAARWLIAIVVAVHVLYTACGADEPGFPYAVCEGEPNADGALLQGTLTLDGGCLYVENENGRWYLAFAEGVAEWDRETSTLTLGGTSASAADDVSFGGSALLVQAFAREWAVEPGEGCDDTLTWLAGDSMLLGLARRS